MNFCLLHSSVGVVNSIVLNTRVKRFARMFFLFNGWSWLAFHPCVRQQSREIRCVRYEAVYGKLTRIKGTQILLGFGMKKKINRPQENNFGKLGKLGIREIPKAISYCVLLVNWCSRILYKLCHVHQLVNKNISVGGLFWGRLLKALGIYCTFFWLFSTSF